MVTRVSVITVFCLAGVLFFSGCGCQKLPEPPTSNELQSAGITPKNSMVLVNNLNLSSYQSLDESSRVETDVKGSATLDFHFVDKTAICDLNANSDNKTVLIARPEPNLPEKIFYLERGVAHFGWAGKGKVNIQVGTYGEITLISADPLIRLIVQPENPRNMVQISVYQGTVTVTVKGVETVLTASRGSTYDGTSGELMPVTPQFSKAEIATFSRISEQLGEKPVTPVYTLTTIANPREGGTVSGAGDYTSGSKATVLAVPGADVIFGGWAGDAAGSENPVVITMDRDKSVVANFVRPLTTLINLSPPSAPQGTSVKISGSGFSANSNITVTGFDMGLGSVTSDVNGSWSTLFTIPPLPAGAYGITATDEIGKSQSTKLQILPTLSQFVVSADGSAMFAYDDFAHLLYKSTDGGQSFTSFNMSELGDRMTAMALSPTFATDQTIVIASTKKVFISTNGGSTFSQVGDLSTFINPSSTITSVDVSLFYRGGMAILVGDGDVDFLTGIGGVSLFTTSSGVWTDMAVPSAPRITGTPDVLAVAFSPNHQIDSEILALTVGKTTTYLWTKFGVGDWGATVAPAVLSPVNRAKLGTIEFPADYDSSTNNNIFVGIAGGGAPELDDAYVIRVKTPTTLSPFTDLNVQGAVSGTEVRSIAVKGGFVGAQVLVGTWGSGTALPIYRTADPSGSVVNWSPGTISPDGSITSAGYSIVAWPPAGNKCYATIDYGGAISYSTDGGVTFQIMPVMDVSAQ